MIQFCFRLVDRKSSVFNSWAGTEEPVSSDTQIPGTLAILKRMRPEWGVLSLGVLGSVIAGGIYTGFAYMYGNLLAVLSLPTEQMLHDAKIWSICFVALAIVASIGMWIRVRSGG